MRSAIAAFIMLAAGAVCSAIPLACARADDNAGLIRPDASRPFSIQPIATFDMPWALAFLPDGRLLVTEKGGNLFLVTPQGERHAVSGVPKVFYQGQNGLLDVALSPRFIEDRFIYLTYMEPGAGGSSLALARARLEEAKAPLLADRHVIWRQSPKGGGGQPGGIVAFSPDGRYLFLTVGERMRKTPAQDLDQALGKVLRLNPDGTTPADNPFAAKGGVAAEVWTLGHRNPYGLAFAPNGDLWLHEMGPMGGDELNLILPGRNYGWPVVSNGDNYDGTPIPRQSTHPEFAAPVIYWNPVIAPAGMAFYKGDMFPQWRGSALIGGLVAAGLVRIAFDGKGGASQVNRWSLGQRIRDVAVAPDGAVWIIEDSSQGRLLRLTPR